MMARRSMRAMFEDQLVRRVQLDLIYCSYWLQLLFLMSVSPVRFVLVVSLPQLISRTWACQHLLVCGISPIYRISAVTGILF